MGNANKREDLEEAIKIHRYKNLLKEDKNVKQEKASFSCLWSAYR